VTALLAAFVSGAIFAVGLGIAGMTQPGKVLAFLDVYGTWDPSLAFVMLGAIATHALLLRLVLARGTPLLAPRFTLPTRRDIDLRLVAGGALFGIGWGLAGFCPGPAVTALAGGRTEPLVFVAAMVAGMALYQFLLEPAVRTPFDANGATTRAQATAGAGMPRPEERGRP
jgi:uncharacterized membrane protein YedE/YeeE